MTTTPPTTKRIDEPTPNGGAYSIATFGSDGSIIEVTEYSADGKAIHRTYAPPSASFPAESS